MPQEKCLWSWSNWRLYERTYKTKPDVEYLVRQNFKRIREVPEKIVAKIVAKLLKKES